MAGTPDPMPIAIALRDIIVADLPAKLDLLDTEYGDDITLENIATANIKFGNTVEFEDYPALLITMLGPQKEDELRSYDYYIHPIAITLVLVGDTGHSATGDPASLLPSEVLALRSGRMLRGIIDVIEAKPYLTVSGVEKVNRIFIDGIDDFADPSPLEDDLWLVHPTINAQAHTSA